MQYAIVAEDSMTATQVDSFQLVAWDENHYCTPGALTMEEAALFRVVTLLPIDPPSYDNITEAVVRDGCEFVNGQWQYKWRKFTLTPGQQLSNIRNLSANLTSQLTAEYESRMSIIGTSYPPSERESWPVQIQEARLHLEYIQRLQAEPASAGSEPNTPWLTNACEARGIDKTELATRIVSKDMMYRTISGKLSGVRQKHEDHIYAAGDNLAALRAIDIKTGWPSFDQA